MSATLMIFGYGFSAAAFAERMRARGFDIIATCRSAEKAARLRAQGITPLIFDGSAPARGDDITVEEALSRATHLLSSVPPGPDGDPVLTHHADLIRGAPPFDWTGYLSTTGVYGDRDGDWVDEESALEPTGERGARRVQAEQAWFSLGDCGPVMSFRLAGIYGPGRSALDTVRQGRARRVAKRGQVFSRIHIADITATLEAAVDHQQAGDPKVGHPRTGVAYNVCDDEAAPPQDVIAHACDLLGVEPPPEIPFEEAELSDMAKSFYRDNKRVRNDRIKRELGVRLTYPTYREGLAAQLAAEAPNG
jgi:nucleoside-diphosphate-sugar epimerase